MRTIRHCHRVAALAAERVYYAAHIEVLEPDHPERRFVAAKGAIIPVACHAACRYDGAA